MRLAFDNTVGRVASHPGEKLQGCEQESGLQSCHSSIAQLESSSYQREPSFILSPCVSVMSETRGSYDGQSTIWAAIEVSGRLSQITQTDGRQNEGQDIGNSSFVDHDLGNFIFTDP